MRDDLRHARECKAYLYAGNGLEFALPCLNGDNLNGALNHCKNRQNFIANIVGVVQKGASTIRRKWLNS